MRLALVLSLLSVGPALAAPAPYDIRLISARRVPSAEGPRVVAYLEVEVLGEHQRPVKPMPLRFSKAGKRLPDVEIDMPGARIVTSTAREGETPIVMLFQPSEKAIIALPSRPLPAGHPATSGTVTVTLDVKSPGDGGNRTLRGPLLAPDDPAPKALRVSAPDAWPKGGFHRGVVYSSWDGTYPHDARWRADLDHFESIGVTWIQVMTFAHQPRVNGPEIELMPAEKWPKAFVAEARRRGFRILIKPHVWSREFYDGSARWRGSITMADDATWDRWFAAYRRFIVREAKMAADAGAEMLSVGLEYVEATRGRTERWRSIIHDVRAVYPGLLTYAADGNHEARHVMFWDALDVIGIDAYFDVGTPGLPGGADLRLGWVPHVAWMKALSTRYGKPIVFTEAGYPSIVGATRTPWKWPKGDETVDNALQAAAFDALLSVCTAGDWCRGVYWWKYYERPERGTSHAHDYSPRGKPAEAVLRRWYTTPTP